MTEHTGWRMETRGVRDVMVPTSRPQTLAEFLLACITEDEAAAREATAADISTVPHEHMERWQPARVLAECEAKRRIVGLHRIDDPNGAAPICNVCLYEPPCDTLLSLAQPYADHPGFREEWR